MSPARTCIDPRNDCLRAATVRPLPWRVPFERWRLPSCLPPLHGCARSASSPTGSVCVERRIPARSRMARASEGDLGPARGGARLRDPVAGSAGTSRRGAGSGDVGSHAGLTRGAVAKGFPVRSHPGRRGTPKGPNMTRSAILPRLRAAGLVLPPARAQGDKIGSSPRSPASRPRGEAYARLPSQSTRSTRRGGLLGGRKTCPVRRDDEANPQKGDGSARIVFKRSRCSSAGWTRLSRWQSSRS